jgi:hypothetical protein
MCLIKGRICWWKESSKLILTKFRMNVLTISCISTTTLIGRYSCYHAWITAEFLSTLKTGTEYSPETMVSSQNVTRWLSRCKRYHKSYPQRRLCFVFIFVVAYNILIRWFRQLSRVTETNSELLFIFCLWVANKMISKVCNWLWLFWSPISAAQTPPIAMWDEVING